LAAVLRQALTDVIDMGILAQTKARAMSNAPKWNGRKLPNRFAHWV